MPGARKDILRRYWVLCYLVSLIQSARFLSNTHWTDTFSILYSLGVYLTYSLLYLVPAIALTGLVRRSAGMLRLESGAFARIGLILTYAVAWLAASVTEIMIYADQTVHGLFGMHLNGFVWNLISTEGGIASMGADASAFLTYGFVIAGFLAVHGVLLGIAMRDPLWGRGWDRLTSHRSRYGLAALFLAVLAAEQLAYGVSDIRGDRAVLLSARAFPFYTPVRFRSFARQLGVHVRRSDDFRLRAALRGIRYPLHPLQTRYPKQPYNLVWLVAESLRADALDPVIMPATWAFAARAHRFTRHYSGGNGTRMGMFTLFYGLYGNYWFPFLEQRRDPVLIDALIDQNYQFELFTSARFSYPEFTRTLFARIPAKHLHESSSGESWERDRVNIGKMIEFIRQRDRSRPFMTFEFFESPHANYHFPPESVIRRPFLEEFNYATADYKRDIELIRNRYINACHHLDSQIARVIQALEQEGILESTIIVITGDHGEEFMEKGRWGHNSEFTEEQIRTPLVLWVPGTGASVVNRMTSHLDVAATLLPLVGVENDPGDYSLGSSLLDGKGRDYTVVSDWSRLGYIDDEYKATLPIGFDAFFDKRVTDPDDRPLEDPSVFYRRRRARLTHLLGELGRFSGGGGPG